FRQLKTLAGRLRPQIQEGGGGESASDRAARLLAQRWIRPRWQRHLASVIERHPDIALILVLTLPLNHIVGLPGFLRSRYGIPVWFYDGDVPASLPSFSGFQSGFRIYQGADLAEYDGFLSNSLGGAGQLLAMGARQV